MFYTATVAPLQMSGTSGGQISRFDNETWEVSKELETLDNGD